MLHRERFFCFVVALTVVNGEILPKLDNQTSSGAIAKQIGEKNVTVEMIDPSTVKVMKPNIFELVNVSGPIHSKIKLICKARGKPLPTVIFRKLGSSEPLVLGQNEYSRVILEEQHFEEKDEVLGTLIISGLFRSDDGLYECIAENKAGIAYKTGHITVEIPPTFGKAQKLHRIAWAWQNHPGNLTCVPEAIPNATIVWERHGLTIDPPFSFFKQEGNTTISHLILAPYSDHRYGKYECWATNKVGSASTWVQLREAYVPNRIPHITQDSVTATTIKWNIEPPHSSSHPLPIRAFIVWYRPEEELSWDSARTHTWSFPSSSYYLTNLVPETTYDFQFAASNDVGRGLFTNGPTITTSRKGPPSEPKIYVPDRTMENGTNITEVSSSADHFKLKWQVIDDNGEPIDSYLIRYCVTEKINEEWRDNNCSDEIKLSEEYTSYELHSLKSDTIYKVELRAHNLLGWSSTAEIRVKAGTVINVKIAPKLDLEPDDTGAWNFTFPPSVYVDFADAPENQFTLAGRDYLVKCKVEGNPIPVVIWSKNGSIIISKDRYVVQDEGLLIKNVTKSDDGVYKCKAILLRPGLTRVKNIKVEVQVLSITGTTIKWKIVPPVYSDKLPIRAFLV